MRSARPRHKAGGWRPVAGIGLLAVCCLLLAGVVSGCATTQETAASKQAESKRILEAREQKRKQRSKSPDHGSEQR